MASLGEQEVEVPDAHDRLVDVGEDPVQARHLLASPLGLPPLLEDAPVAQGPFDGPGYAGKRLRRFHDVVEGARLHRLHGDLFVAEARHHENREAPLLRRRGQDLDGPAIGKVEVDEGEIRDLDRRFPAELAQRSNRDQDGSGAGLLEGPTDGLGVRRIVLDDEDQGAIDSRPGSPRWISMGAHSTPASSSRAYPGGRRTAGSRPASPGSCWRGGRTPSPCPPPPPM